MRTLNTRRAFMPALAAALLSTPAWADDSSPVGLWKSIDDVTGKPRVLVRIVESAGTLEGKIEKVFLRPNEDPNMRCEKCEGALKNAPVIGLAMLTGLKKSGDEYVGGQIVDADNGKVYSSKLRLTDGGKKLEVRGYIGVPMLGRSQVWERQE